jgi:Ca2+-binding EF-hand superfamily protein
MKATPIILAILSTSFTFATLANDQSADKKAEAERMFKNYDTDGDGSISLEEYRAGQGPNMSPARVPKVFAEKDLNKDGKLNMEEFLYVPADQRQPTPKPAADKTAAPKTKTK